MSWLKLQRQEGIISQRPEGLQDVGLLFGMGPLLRLLDGETPQSSACGRGCVRHPFLCSAEQPHLWEQPQLLTGSR